MIIYIASDGQARLVSPQHVYQGSSVTDITVIAPFPAQTAMTVAFSLPDGKMFGGVQGTMQTPPYIMTLLPDQSGLPDGVQAWQYVMPSAITQNAGQAKVSIVAQFAQGSGQALSFTQQTSAQVEFTIEPSTVGTLPDEPTEDVWKQVLAAISEIDGKILAAQNDISDIENGDTTVGKAKADQKGNVIDETYATQTALAETNEALAVEQENVDDLQNRMTAVEDNITEIRDNASDALEYSEQAFDNSETAVQTANQAKTVADGIDAKATTALETSNVASSNAAQALQKANAATETANAAQAAVASKQDATDNNLDTTDKTVVGAINENKTAIDGLRQDILNEAHFRGYFATNAEIQATTANLNDFAYSAQSGTVWIYGASGWADSGKPVPDKTTPLSDATPAQDGTAAAGASTSAARGDHVHPTDNTRAAKSTVDSIISGAQVVGAATKATQDANGNNIAETYATKDELTETTGTEVKVNGATQPEVNFTSDPQTQITANKNAIAEAQSDISDIIDGSLTSKKAEQDSDGNVIDTTYAKLSQVVTKDSSGNVINAITDAAKYFLRNKQVSTSAVAINATGWYRIAKLPTYSSSRITVMKQYNYGRGISLILDVAVGADNTEDATTNIVASYAGMQGQSDYIDKIRYMQAGSGQVYIDVHIISDGNVNSYWLAYDGASVYTTFTSSEFALYQFQQTSDTGGTELPMPEDTGLATSGTIYQQGAPVFATDPSKLEPSTANGWTQTTATGTLPSAGVYMIKIPGGNESLEGIGIMIYDGSDYSACTLAIMGNPCVVNYTPSGSDKWSVNNASGMTIEVQQVYYKRIA